MRTQYDFRDLAYGLDVALYLKQIGFDPFEWQRDVVRSTSRRKIINGARQSGKSTIISAMPCHIARFVPKSLNIIMAPTEAQSVEDMIKVYDFIAHDRRYPKIVRKSDALIQLENDSRILVVVATDRSARGYSRPRTIVMDEASRIPDVVYKSGVRPMLTDNPECELLLISTPFGREGFFYESWTSRATNWTKFEVRSPYDTNPVDQWHLEPSMPEEDFMAERKARGIKAYYSPRHRSLEEQEENLQTMGILQYRQEYCCEFVETNAAVFTYEDLDRMFDANLIESPGQSDGPAVAPNGLLIPKRLGGTFF